MVAAAKTIASGKVGKSSKAPKDAVIKRPAACKKPAVSKKPVSAVVKTICARIDMFDTFERLKATRHGEDMYRRKVCQHAIQHWAEVGRRIYEEPRGPERGRGGAVQFRLNHVGCE